MIDRGTGAAMLAVSSSCHTSMFYINKLVLRSGFNLFMQAEAEFADATLQVNSVNHKYSLFKVQRGSVRTLKLA